MKKCMIMLTLVSAIASIDMLHASAPAAAAAGAGAAVASKLHVVKAADVDVKYAAEPKEFTANQAMQFIKKHYDSAPLSSEGLKDMIAYTANLIQFDSYTLLNKSREANNQKISKQLADDMDKAIAFPVIDNLMALRSKMNQHSKHFFSEIYEKASYGIINISDPLGEQIVVPQGIEFLMRLRFFLQEKAAIAATANALKAKASTIKPAGGPALEEDTQEA